MRRVPFIAVAAVAALPGLPGTSQMGVYPGLRPPGDLAAPGPALTDSGVGVYPALTAPEQLVFPGPAAVPSAARYASARGGKVAFAVADTRGVVAGVLGVLSEVVPGKKALTFVGAEAAVRMAGP